MGIERINRRSSIIGGTGLGGRQQSPLVARGPMFAGYDIPPQEVAELYKLYTQTGGPSWINNTNWFANKTCSTWYGLTVAGGRVTDIQLQNNNLAGMTNFSPKPFLALVGFRAYKLTTNGSLILGFSLSELPSLMRDVHTYGSASLITGGPIPMVATAVRQILLSATSQTAAIKNSVIERIYADRALFTEAAHTLNINGGPALTGIYQAANPPTTPAEKAFSLVNDNLGEGFLKWGITL